MNLLLLIVWRIGAYPVICLLAYGDWHEGKLDGFWLWVVCWFSFSLICDELLAMTREKPE